MLLNRVQMLELKEDESSRAMRMMGVKLKRLEEKVDELIREREVGRALLELSGGREGEGEGVVGGNGNGSA